MELNLSRQTAPECSIAADLTAEAPVESDLLLPDYYPDIWKVLKCGAAAAVSSAEVSGARVQIEGSVQLSVIYLSEERRLCCQEVRLPFSKAVELHNEAERPVILANAGVSYCNCRAVSSRRLDLHGAVSLRLIVLSQRPQDYISGCATPGVQLLRRRLPFTEVPGEYSRTFTVHEEAPLPHGSPDAASLLHARGGAQLDDCKVLPNKLVTKGELSLRCLYAPLADEDAETSPAPRIAEFTLPLSQILDAEGVDEDCLCDARYRLLSLDCRMVEDGTGFTVDATIRAFARVHRERELTAVSDAYSTRCACKPELRPSNALQLLKKVDASFPIREEIDLPQGVGTPLEIWMETPEPPVLHENGDGLLCRARLCLLTREEDGCPAYFEKSLELPCALPLPESGGAILPELWLSASPASLETTPGPHLELRCELRVQGCLYTMERFSALTGLTLDEDHPKDPAALPALTLYYADGGERLWDIAKRYGSTPEEIAAENALEEDVVDARRMLLIPVV